MTRANHDTLPLPQNQNAHSPRFEELAVLLPEYIDHPLLKPLVQKLQDSMYQAFDLGGEAELGEISQSQTILDLLLTTPIADASVLVVITNEPKPKLLLTRRAAHLNSHAGEVSFVGGKHDEGDGNNVVTALREACEESALPPNKAQIVGQLPTQTSKSGLSVRPIVALVNPPITYVPELGEIERIFWADLETIISEPTTDYVLAYEMGDNCYRIKTPSWIVDGEVVWGLTGRILASLLEIGYDREMDWYYLPADS